MEAAEVFEILVRENADMLITFIRAAVRDDSLADDIFQETMLVAWRRLDSYDRARPFAPWLRGIARRVLLAHFRGNRRQFYTCSEMVLERLDAWTASLEQAQGDTWQEKLEALDDCITRLPTHYRVAIQARYERDLTHDRIAEELELSLPGVKKRLQRARERLFDCIQRKLRRSPQHGVVTS